MAHFSSIGTKLQIDGKKRDLASFDQAIENKLRGFAVIVIRADDMATRG